MVAALGGHGFGGCAQHHSPGPPPRSAADGAPSSPQAFKEAILGSYQSLNQLTEEAAGRIKEVYKSPEIQGLINDKEQKLDLDDNAF